MQWLTNDPEEAKMSLKSISSSILSSTKTTHSRSKVFFWCFKNPFQVYLRSRQKLRRVLQGWSSRTLLSLKTPFWNLPSRARGLRSQWKVPVQCCPWALLGLGIDYEMPWAAIGAISANFVKENHCLSWEYIIIPQGTIFAGAVTKGLTVSMSSQ